MDKKDYKIVTGYEFVYVIGEGKKKTTHCLLIEGDYQNSLIFIDKLVLTLNNI